MSDPLADLLRAMENAWDEGYVKALTDDGHTIESSGYHLRVNPYAAPRDKITVTVEPVPDAQKSEIDAEGADHAGNVQSTPAGEGGKLGAECLDCGGPVCRVLGGPWVHVQPRQDETHPANPGLRS